MTLGIVMDGGPLFPPDGNYSKNSKAVTMGIGELLLYSMTQNKIIGLVMNEAEALGVNYHIGSSSR